MLECYDRHEIASACVCFCVLNSLMQRIGMICDKYRLNCVPDCVLKLQWSDLTTLSTPFHCCRLCSQFCVFTKRWQIMRLNPFTWFPCLCRKLLSLCYIICRTTPQNPFLNVITQVEDDSATIKMLLWIYGGDMLIFLNWKRGSFSGTL